MFWSSIPKRSARRYLIISNGLVAGMILVLSFCQNFLFTGFFSSDLRNRVVGARLVKDGKIPYFYKWSTGDDTRYFDPQNTDNRIVSSITASPVFHHLLSPVCDLPQHTISVLWFIASYISLSIIIGLAMVCCDTLLNRLVILNIGALFCLTDAFKIHIIYGQLYIFNALIIMVVYFLLLKDKRRTNISAGLSMTLLLLIRPLAAVFIYPFIFFIKGRSRLFLGTVVTITSVYACFCLLSKNEMAQWGTYGKAIDGHSNIRSHPVQLNDQAKNITDIEGYHIQGTPTAFQKKPTFPAFETFNIDLFYKKFTGNIISAPALAITWIFCMTILCLAYFKIHRRNYELSKMFIFGYILYVLSEIFAPVYRNIYCAVQFFPIILIYLSVSRSFYTWSAVLIFLGLFLNITNFSFLPMRHSIGEILMSVGFLIFIFKERMPQPVNT